MGDWVGLVETAYDLDGDASRWLSGVVAIAAPLLDQGAGLTAWTYTMSPSRFRMDALEVSSSDANLAALSRQVLAATGEGMLRDLVTRPAEGGTLGSTVFKTHPDEERMLARSTADRFHDVYGLVAPTGTGRGLVLGAPMGSARPITTPELGRLRRVAAHIGAGLRLRDALETVRASRAPEAVLDAGARLHDASGPAQTARARDWLREAVRRRERARSKRERADPDAALALWEGLVAGRWSLVDHFESDGRRFVVAHKNDPELGDPRGLSRRERQVAEYVGMGRSEKEIAYLLGIAATGVSNATHRALVKLGLGGRAELASFFTPGGLRARLAEVELAGEHLVVGAAPLLDESALERLSAAERDVALALLRGATVLEIAKRRASSPLTVETQVKSVYEKLGVGSRHELATRVSAAAP